MGRHASSARMIALRCAGGSNVAGDWIKMRTNLDGDPRVIQLAEQLGIPDLHAVGMLWKVWAWADSHSIDGNALGVTRATLDRFAGVSGFADALRTIGWLDGRDGALTFPRFAEHNGQTAKTRAQTSKRVQQHRNTRAVADVTQRALPEKRREEKSVSKPIGSETSARTGPMKRPTVKEVAEFVATREVKIDPQAFVDHYTANGWMVGGRSPMKDWQAAVRTWESRETGANPRTTPHVNRADSNLAVANDYVRRKESTHESKPATDGGGGDGFILGMEPADGERRD